MKLNEIITKQEQEAVKAYIDAINLEASARLRLTAAAQRTKAAADALTEALFRQEQIEGRLERVSALPESFAIFHKGYCYLVHLDVEGESCHEVKLLAGLLEE